MSDVFISYKSEDVERVGRLARALEGSGLDVWWDRQLAGGENWHEQIGTALEKAKCVVVVWTQGSVGASGDFVRDEARGGKQRGILVPVRLDRVAPPLGFGEIQAIDLTRWKGGTSDVFFQYLVAAVRAKVAGRPVPAGRGPVQRLRQRVTYGTVVGLLGAAIGAFGSDTFHLQEKVCAAGPQAVSDVCGTFGFGGRPTKEERVAWAARRPGNCEDLRKHLGRFPGGAYQGVAQGLLAGREVRETAVWAAGVRKLAFHQGQAEKESATLEEAKAAALAGARRGTENLCRGFAATGLYRYESAEPEAQEWECGRVGGGYVCAFDGQAVCGLEEKSVKTEETCGGSASGK